MSLFSRKYDQDLIVIGAGSGGLVSAYIAAAAKAKVTLIEREKMGGDCLNTGCVPSKSFIHSTKLLSMAKESSRYGIKKMTSEFDFKEIMASVQRSIEAIEPHDSVDRYRSLGVNVLEGEAEIISNHEVRIKGHDGNEQTLTTKSIIIATGGRPFVPPIEGLDASHKQILTSDNLWQLQEQPKTLGVVGAGPIGCEMAQCFARIDTKVSLFDISAYPLAIEDEEAQPIIAKQFTNDGIELKMQCGINKVEHTDNGVIVHYKQDGQDQQQTFDYLLIATGRKANLGIKGLDALDLTLTPRKTIEVNDYLQTSVSNVYACGDCVGPFQFTHAASHQAWYATMNALFGSLKKFKVNYRVLPKATYTFPEVASVGLSVKEAKEKHGDVDVTTFPIKDLNRAETENHTEGFVKYITTKKGAILGSCIVAPHASDMIAEVSLAMQHNLGLDGILKTIHAYPSWPEANKLAAGKWKQTKIPGIALKASTVMLKMLNR